MINRIIAIAVATLLLFATNPVKSQKPQLEGKISLSGAFALYPLAVKWAEEFQKIHPKVRIDVSGGGAGKGMTDALAKVVDLGMVSREIHQEEITKGAWFVAVAKDAVIPTINSKNPKLNEILAKGLTQDAARKIFITQEYKTWGDVLGVKSTIPIHLFTRSDACGAAETWAKYLGKKQEDLMGTAVFGDPGLASAIQKDPLSIGYNNISYAYNQKTKKPNPGIVVFPIDVDGNGKIDTYEDFYQTSDVLIQAIADDKYPSPPARDLYLVSNGKPTNRVIIEFLNFILTEGQKYNVPSGFIGLSNEKQKANLSKLK
jgi:phosphate transport system substrate-binding protein